MTKLCKKEIKKKPNKTERKLKKTKQKNQDTKEFVCSKYELYKNQSTLQR